MKIIRHDPRFHPQIRSSLQKGSLDDFFHKLDKEKGRGQDDWKKESEKKFLDLMNTKGSSRKTSAPKSQSHSSVLPKDVSPVTGLNRQQIGTTGNGKTVYHDSPLHFDEHKNWSKNDHHDAAHLHYLEERTTQEPKSTYHWHAKQYHQNMAGPSNGMTDKEYHDQQQLNSYDTFSRAYGRFRSHVTGKQRSFIGPTQSGKLVFHDSPLHPHEHKDWTHDDHYQAARIHQNFVNNSNYKGDRDVDSYHKFAEDYHDSMHNHLKHGHPSPKENWDKSSLPAKMSHEEFLRKIHDKAYGNDETKKALDRLTDLIKASHPSRSYFKDIPINESTTLKPKTLKDRQAEKPVKNQTKPEEIPHGPTGQIVHEELKKLEGISTVTGHPRRKLGTTRSGKIVYHDSPFHHEPNWNQSDHHEAALIHSNFAGRERADKNHEKEVYHHAAWEHHETSTLNPKHLDMPYMHHRYQKAYGHFISPLSGHKRSVIHTTNSGKLVFHDSALHPHEFEGWNNDDHNEAANAHDRMSEHWDNKGDSKKADYHIKAAREHLRARDSYKGKKYPGVRLRQFYKKGYGEFEKSLVKALEAKEKVLQSIPLGKTRSGKKIFYHSVLSHGNDWDEQDHADAEKSHLEFSKRINADSQNKLAAKVFHKHSADYHRQASILSPVVRHPDFEKLKSQYANHAQIMTEKYKKVQEGLARLKGVLPFYTAKSLFKSENIRLMPIGKTRSGKKVFHHSALTHGDDWTFRDHRDAAKLHSKQYQNSPIDRHRDLSPLETKHFHSNSSNYHDHMASYLNVKGSVEAGGHSHHWKDYADSHKEMADQAREKVDNALNKLAEHYPYYAIKSLSKALEWESKYNDLHHYSDTNHGTYTIIPGFRKRDGNVVYSGSHFLRHTPIGGNKYNTIGKYKSVDLAKNAAEEHHIQINTGLQKSEGSVRPIPLGKTSSGKHVFHHSPITHDDDWSAKDHQEASNLHQEKAENIRNLHKEKTLASGKWTRGGFIQNANKINYHRDAAMYHRAKSIHLSTNDDKFETLANSHKDDAKHGLIRLGFNDPYYAVKSLNNNMVKSMGSAPNYRSSDSFKACTNCAFFTIDGICEKFSFRAKAHFVCASWETPAIKKSLRVAADSLQRGHLTASTAVNKLSAASFTLNKSLGVVETTPMSGRKPTRSEEKAERIRQANIEAENTDTEFKQKKFEAYKPEERGATKQQLEERKRQALKQKYGEIGSRMAQTQPGALIDAPIAALKPAGDSRKQKQQALEQANQRADMRAEKELRAKRSLREKEVGTQFDQDWEDRQAKDKQQAQAKAAATKIAKEAEAKKKRSEEQTSAVQANALAEAKQKKVYRDKKQNKLAIEAAKKTNTAKNQTKPNSSSSKDPGKTSSKVDNLSAKVNQVLDAGGTKPKPLPTKGWAGMKREAKSGRFGPEIAQRSRQVDELSRRVKQLQRKERKTKTSTVAPPESSKKTKGYKSTPITKEMLEQSKKEESKKQRLSEFANPPSITTARQRRQEKEISRPSQLESVPEFRHAKLKNDTKKSLFIYI